MIKRLNIDDRSRRNRVIKIVRGACSYETGPKGVCNLVLDSAGDEELLSGLSLENMGISGDRQGALHNSVDVIYGELIDPYAWKAGFSPQVFYITNYPHQRKADLGGVEISEGPAYLFELKEQMVKRVADEKGFTRAFDSLGDAVVKMQTRHVPFTDYQPLHEEVRYLCEQTGHRRASHREQAEAGLEYLTQWIRGATGVAISDLTPDSLSRLSEEEILRIHTWQAKARAKGFLERFIPQWPNLFVFCNTDKKYGLKFNDDERGIGIRIAEAYKRAGEMFNLANPAVFRTALNICLDEKFLGQENTDLDQPASSYTEDHIRKLAYLEARKVIGSLH